MMKTLEELGMRQNTMIVFCSDNGGAYEANIGPYKGGKTDLHEGGIRVPGIVSWPARLPKGVVTKMIGHHCDLLPTFCAAAGVPIARTMPLDGMNLLAALEKKTVPARGPIHWQIDLYPHIQRHYEKPKPYATEATRRGPWKLMSRDGVPVALYHIGDDPLETANLLEKQPQLVAEMTALNRTFLSTPRNRTGFAAKPQ
jgi:N-acetylgalactosamine-6-sulfatase